MINISKKEINAVTGTGPCWIRCQTYVGHAQELTCSDNVQDYRFDVPNDVACRSKLVEVKKWFHAYCAVMQWPGN